MILLIASPLSTAGIIERIAKTKSTIKSLEYFENSLILKKYFASMEELKLDKKSLIFETEETQIFKL